jgi:ElaB/YqjD/DUF883 family membrane-anchored ribosome-binding protein
MIEPTCKLCGKTFQDERGLRGHMRFKHSIDLTTGKQLIQAQTPITRDGAYSRLTTLTLQRKGVDADLRKLRDETKSFLLGLDMSTEEEKKLRAVMEAELKRLDEAIKLLMDSILERSESVKSLPAARAEVK